MFPAATWFKSRGGFIEIYLILRSHTALKEEEVNDLSIKIDDRLINFLDVYQKNMTTYIHFLSSHVIEFFRKYGILAPFSQQGLE